MASSANKFLFALLWTLSFGNLKQNRAHDNYIIGNDKGIQGLSLHIEGFNV
jgi:hypothetical protein